MIKHLSLVTVFIILHSLGGLAQSKVTVGKPYDVIDADSKLYFTRGGEILTVKIDKKKNVILQKLSSIDLTFKGIKMYDDFPKGAMLEKITQFKNRYFLFFTLYEDKLEQLFYREIDFAKGAFIGGSNKLITSDEKISGMPVMTGFYRFSTTDKFNFYFSYDSSSMVVQYRVQSQIRNDAKSFDRIGLHVFDQTMTEKWGKRVEMPYTEKKMDNLNYTVDSKGNVYIATRIFEDNTTDLKKRDEEEPNYHLEILKIESSGKVSSTPVDVADKFIKTILLYENAKGSMVGAGYYNKGKQTANADGVMMFSLGANGKLSNLNTYEIPTDVLNQYATGREKRQHNRSDKDDKAEFENLSLRDVVNGKDGSILLVGEQRYAITRTRYNSSTHTSSSTTTYYCNDILVTKIDPSGKLAWMKKLPKRQLSTVGYYGLSYRYVRGNTNHYFFCLDNEKNLDLPLSEVPASHVAGQGGFLTAYIVNDKTGEVMKKSLVDTRDIQGMEVYQFDPDRIMFTAAYTLVFEAYKKKKEDILVKVVLDH
ncbi:MAG TPA: hypothetical protein VIU12_17810 [Chryseolinea sp.]